MLLAGSGDAVRLVPRRAPRSALISASSWFSTCRPRGDSVKARSSSEGAPAPEPRSPQPTVTTRTPRAVPQGRAIPHLSGESARKSPRAPVRPNRDADEVGVAGVEELAQMPVRVPGGAGVLVVQHAEHQDGRGHR